MSTASRCVVMAWLALIMVPDSPSRDLAPVLAVIVNRSNPIEDLSLNQLRKILIGEISNFSGRDHQKLVLVQRDPESQVYQTMLLRVLRMTPPEYKRLLLANEFRGAEPLTVKTLNSDDTAAKFVFNVPEALAVIAAVPAIPAIRLVRILRIDGKLPGEPGYKL